MASSFFCSLCHIRFAVATRLKKAMTFLSFIYRTTVQCLYIRRRLYFVFAKPQSVGYDVTAVVVNDVIVFISYLPSPRRLGVKSVRFHSCEGVTSKFDDVFILYFPSLSRLGVTSQL